MIGMRDLEGPHPRHRRLFTDYEFISRLFTGLRESGMNKVVVGGSRGSEELVLRWARENAFPYQELPPDVQAYGKLAAYEARNHLVIQLAHRILFLWDGQNKAFFPLMSTAIKVNKEVLLVPLMMA